MVSLETSHPVVIVGLETRSSGGYEQCGAGASLVMVSLEPGHVMTTASWRLGHPESWPVWTWYPRSLWTSRPHGGSSGWRGPQHGSPGNALPPRLIMVKEEALKWNLETLSPKQRPPDSEGPLEAIFLTARIWSGRGKCYLRSCWTARPHLLAKIPSWRQRGPSLGRPALKGFWGGLCGRGSLLGISDALKSMVHLGNSTASELESLSNKIVSQNID